MKIKMLLIPLLLVSVLSACSNESQDAVQNIRQKVGDAIAGEHNATPTPLVETTPTSEPTVIPEPTDTPEPTATLEPTPTPEPDTCAPGACRNNPVNEPLSVTFDEDGFYTKVIYGASDFTLTINNISALVLTIEITPTIPGSNNTYVIQPNQAKGISLYEPKQASDYNGNITLNGTWEITGSDPLSQSIRIRITS